MNNHFPKSYYKNNRENLRKQCSKNQPIIISGNGQIQSTSDETYKFTQDPNFYYLTGLNYPDLILVIDIDKEYIILPSRSKNYEAFNGKLDNSVITNISGIREIFDEKVGWIMLKDLLSKYTSIYSTNYLPIYLKKYGFYSNPVRRQLIRKIKYLNPKIKIDDVLSSLAELRSYKQPLEIEAIKQAINISNQSFSQILKNLSEYKFENEIEADLLSNIKKIGNTSFSFDPIIASGKNSTTLHYTQNNSVINKNDLIIIDFGVQYSGYNSDITRTIKLNKKLNNRQRDIYLSVEETQEYALSLLKPGVILSDYEKKVRAYLGNKLYSLKLIKTKSLSEIFNYYPQLTSHYLGLAVHDVGFYDKPLPENSVITVEPGIYIKEEGIGVRIEDDILITSRGNKNLSETIAKISVK